MRVDGPIAWPAPDSIELGLLLHLPLKSPRCRTVALFVYKVLDLLFGLVGLVLLSRCFGHPDLSLALVRPLIHRVSPASLAHARLFGRIVGLSIFRLDPIVVWSEHVRLRHALWVVHEHQSWLPFNLHYLSIDLFDFFLVCPTRMRQMLLEFFFAQFDAMSWGFDLSVRAFHQTEMVADFYLTAVRKNIVCLVLIHAQRLIRVGLPAHWPTFVGVLTAPRVKEIRVTWVTVLI